MSKINYNRRDVLKALCSGAASFAIPGSVFYSCGIGPIRKKPNVLFIAVDDLRPQLKCYGHEQMISPNIDRLASQGVTFKRTYCQVPVCGASRASLLTGVRPTRNRFVNYETWVDRDLPGALTLPGHFLNNGYQTLSNGKVFHHLEDNEQSWSEPAWWPEGPWRNYWLERNKTLAQNNPRGVGPAFEVADVADQAYRDGKIADKSISDLKRLKGVNQPFFFAVGFRKPHLPFNAPKKYWDLYKRENINLVDNPFRPKGAPDAALHNWGELRQYTNIPKQGSLSDALARTLIHGYYACVSYTDAQIGRMLTELDNLGLRDNTIVVLWGDHGWQLGEHGLWCKHCNFETSLHSPMIISTPWHVGDQKTNALTEFVDIYPTICELCDLPMPDHLDGKSAVPLLENPNRPWKEAVFSRFKDGDSIKTDRFRYTEWSKTDGNVYARMLFDHIQDPFENLNISELPENQEIIQKLSKMLRDGGRQTAL